jgi:hypothetical protein
MIKFKAKIKGLDKWTEGSSLVETSDGYVIINGGMEWYDGSEWSSGNSNFTFIDIETLIIQKQ